MQDHGLKSQQVLCKLCKMIIFNEFANLDGKTTITHFFDQTESKTSSETKLSTVHREDILVFGKLVQILIDAKLSFFKKNVEQFGKFLSKNV